MDNIENTLKTALRTIKKNTSPNSERRQTAVRWLNRLYYDLGSWQKEFLSLLRTYPGFKATYTENDFLKFRKQLESFGEQLERFRGLGRDPDEICARIDFLAARFKKDFEWLRTSDKSAYYELARAIQEVDDFPGAFRSLSQDLYDRFYKIAHNILGPYQNIKGQYERVAPPPDKVKAAIRKYERSSTTALNGIRDAAQRIGVSLLSVEEYEDALRTEGSTNPQLLVLGEVSMSQDTYNIDNRGGILNLKSRIKNVTQTISNAEGLNSKAQDTLQQLISRLDQELTAVSPDNSDLADRVVTQVETASKEIAKASPNKGFLKITLQGLEHAAQSFSKVMPPVLSTVNDIVQFVTKHFNL